MKPANEFFDQQLLDRPVVVILRGVPAHIGVEMATKAWDAGVPMVEVPLQTDHDVECLRAIRVAASRRSRPVGAGTITSVKLVEAAAEEGAEFTVAPGWDPAVAQRSIELGMAHLPGVATATEVQSVLQSGLHWMKAFPADALGERWFAGMKGPFPDSKFVATGGVDAENAQRLLAAGAAAVALGSSFQDIPSNTLEELCQGK